MNFIDIILIILIICFVLLNNKRKKGYKNKRLTNEKIIMLNKRRKFSLSLSELEF